MRNDRPVTPPRLGALTLTKRALEPRVLDRIGAEQLRLDKARAIETDPSSRRRRASGRTFGSYTFYPEADGLLTYRDPQKDFIAVLMSNGDMEFETRAVAAGGLCAIGVCVQAGGLRAKNERKRKRLNRVRIRFAPVPLGVGGVFGSLRGVEQRQLELMRATFEARFEMRIETQRRWQKAALQRLGQELKEVVSNQPPRMARKILLDRALEIGVETMDPAQLDPRTRSLRMRLHERKKAGAVAMCEKILRFAQGLVKPKPRWVFEPKDLVRILRHCEALS